MLRGRLTLLKQGLAPRLLGRQIAQCSEAFGGDFQHPFPRGVVVLKHALQVVLEAGEHIGKMLKLRLRRRGLTDHQLLVDVIVAAAHQARRTGQRNHRQRTAHLGQQLGQ